MSCDLVCTDYADDVDVTFEKYVAQNQPCHPHPAIITYEITSIIRLIREYLYTCVYMLFKSQILAKRLKLHFQKLSINFHKKCLNINFVYL